ncbi:MAG: DUF2141 domain-containing protein [Rhodospirillales bacterium]|nr:DUF2141 domain-containing protein [Rhodospirillales bacterium]
MNKCLFPAILWMATGVVAMPCFAAELQILLDGVRNDQGELRVAIYQSPEGFATEAGRYKEVVLPANRSSNVAIFQAIPAGTYGVAAFHDENRNGEFDKNFIGFPKEGFGFGNDAPVRLGPPRFSEAAVTVVEDDFNRHALTFRYW